MDMAQIDSHPSIPRRGMMFALSSPSGAGKTTLSRKMLALDEHLNLSISATTRAPRPGEIDGEDYHFMDEDKFARMTMEEAFLEHARVFDHYYGTPRGPVERALEKGHDILFDVDWQGTRQLKYNARKDLVSVFILPPSLAELRRRLLSRSQDSEEVVEKRMEKAIDEISHWDEYDYVIVNTDIEQSLNQIMSILYAERTRRIRCQPGLEGFVRELAK